jgi:hypothetical protein
MDRNPLMPKATAVWLLDNTSLSFEQIAEFCGLHVLDVKGIADGDVAHGIKGMDPISSGQLTREEIARGEKDGSYRLKLAEPKVEVPEVKTKRGPRYTPVSRRQDRPNAILWLLKNHPELKDSQIMRLVGTTKPTIIAIRERTHWNSTNLVAQDPVALSLCSQIDLDAEVKKAAARLARERHEGEAEPAKAGTIPAEQTIAAAPAPEPEAPMATALAQEAREAMAAPDEIMAPGWIAASFGTRSPKRRSGFFLSLSAGLAGLVAFELTSGPFFVPDAHQESPSVDDIIQYSPKPPVEKLAMSTFAEVVTRPLFTPLRRPPSPRPKVAASAPKPEILDLVGVIISADRRMALLRPRNKTEGLFAMEGQTIAGWEVRAIKPTQVVLGWGNDTEVIKISDAGKSSAIGDPSLSGTATLPAQHAIADAQHPIEEWPW